MFPISFKALNDQQRHDYILKTFILNKAASSEQRKHKRDIDIIKEHHRFLWDSEVEAADGAEDSWEVRLARRYYDKLFKEYCIADLSRYKENKVALRWRTEAEVVAGKGQFQCGSRKCEERENLRSWEVNFAYQEHGERKNALVKLRLCGEHSAQLNYTSKKREVKRLRHIERQQAKGARRQGRRSTAKSSKGDAHLGPEEDEGNGERLPRSTSSEEDKEEVGEANREMNEKPRKEENIWNKKLELETEPVSRETEFERYLEDLLL